jgi:YD repeat-containing protein
MYTVQILVVILGLIKLLKLEGIGIATNHYGKNLIILLSIISFATPTYADTYTYDDLNRLTKVVYDNGQQITYTYDAAGNILSQKVTGQSSSQLRYQSVQIDTTKKIITLNFDRDVFGNTNDLKGAISFAANGTSFLPLGATDTVKIEGNKILVTFNTPLIGNQNKIKIAANTLKDSSGVVLTAEVITDEIDAGPIVVPPITPPPITPPIPPGEPTTPEQFTQINTQVTNAIENATTSEMIVAQLNEVTNLLANFVHSSTMNEDVKLQVVQNTIDTVFEAMIQKMNKGIINEGEVKESAVSLLDEVLIPVIPESSDQDRHIFEAYVETLSSFIETVIMEVELSTTDQLTSSLQGAIGGILQRIDDVTIVSEDRVEDLSSEITFIKKVIQEFTNRLGDKTALVQMEKKLDLFFQGAESPLRLSAAVVNQLISNDFALFITNEEEAGIMLPRKVLLQMANKSLDILMTNMSTFGISNRSSSRTSNILDVRLATNGKPVTNFGSESVTITMPFKIDTSKNLIAYIYNEKSKGWKAITKGKFASSVVKNKSSVQFETTVVGKIKVAEVTISNIAFTEKAVTLIPGANHQLQVVATTNDKNQILASSAETGTTYLLSDTKSISVTTGGLIHVNEGVKDGTKVTVTAINNQKLAKITVTIRTVKSLRVEPKKLVLKPGEKKGIKVKAVLSNNSIIDISSGTFGTLYTSGNNNVAQVDTNGTITVSKNVKSGDQTTIKISVNEISTEIPIIIK